MAAKGDGTDAPDRTDVLYVTQHKYQGQDFSQKHIPAKKLPAKVSTRIAAVEQLLADRYSALQADEANLFLTPACEAEFAAALQALATARPAWSVVACNDEVEFYSLLNDRRQRAQQQPAPAGR